MALEALLQWGTKTLLQFVAETKLFLVLLMLYILFCRWNSWNHFFCNISEDVIKQAGNIIYLDLFYLHLLDTVMVLKSYVLDLTADVLVSSGLSKLGYKYVNIGM